MPGDGRKIRAPEMKPAKNTAKNEYQKYLMKYVFISSKSCAYASITSSLQNAQHESAARFFSFKRNAQETAIGRIRATNSSFLPVRFARKLDKRIMRAIASVIVELSTVVDAEHPL